MSDNTRTGSVKGIEDKYPELNTMLDDIRGAGMTVTKKWFEIWNTAVCYAWGRQLQDWKLKEDWEYVVVNRIYPLMFQSIAKLAGNNPKMLAHPWDEEQPSASEFAQKWANHAQYLWESPYELGMRLKLIMGLLDCAVFGYMVGATKWELKPRGGWDDTQKTWIGKPDEYFIHPTLFWADPSAENLATAENCGTKRRVKLEWALNRWPKFKDEIEKQAYTSNDPQYTAGDLIVYKNQKGDTLSVSRKKMFSRLVDLILGSGTSSTTADVSDQKYVDIEEIYWRDYEEKHIKIEDNVPADTLLKQGTVAKEEITGIFIDTEKKKPLEEWPKQVINEFDEPLYPNGRFVLRIGRTILNPKPEEQVYKESRWPFTVMPYHILPHMWQGGNAVEMSRNNNDFLNITVSSMVNQVRRTADPTKIVEAGALAKDRENNIRTTRDDISGLGKLVIAAKGKIGAISNMVYPALDSSVPMLAQLLKQDIDDQMFMQAIARGESPKKQQTAAESVRLNQNALDYVGLQGIFLDQWIDDTVTLIVELCQRNYEPGRLMKMLSDGTQSGVKADQSMLDVRFDINIEPGSTLPFDEVKKQNEYATAYKLLENPVPNPMIEDMLRILNISKRKEILDKYKGLQIFRQFIMLSQQAGQMMAQQPQPGADPQQAMAMQMQAAQAQQAMMGQVTQLMQAAAQLAPQGV
jgi:hypothetical protein